MRREHLVIRGLTFYWRTHLAVVLGVATSVAVLAGALLVGTSVRASLRDLLLAQIGRTDEVVASQHFFTEALGSSIEGDRTFATSFQHLAPLIVARGIVTSQESQRRAGDVTVYGVDDRFWRFTVWRSPGRARARLTSVRHWPASFTFRRMGRWSCVSSA